MAATLTPGATTGKNILFTASEACFLLADVGRQIIFEASRAIIVSFGVSAGDVNPNTVVHADIIDPFPNTQPIPAGQWFLRLSPQAELTPSVKGPVGTKITLTADRHTFRNADYSKFIHIYGGVVEIQGITSTTEVVGEILSVLQVDEISAGSGTYPGALAGTWTLEVSSWSPENGFPRTGEFGQGRLIQASTLAQPTTFWMSAPDDYDNYAVGSKADDAIEYTIASRMLNRIEAIVENGDPTGSLQTSLYMLCTNLEMIISSGKTNEPFGGDIIPAVNKLSTEGSAPIQPFVSNNKILFVDRSRRRIFVIAYDAASASSLPIEITAIADHITDPYIKLGPVAYQKRLDKRFYFVRNDGVLITLTYFPDEKVIGFTRITTDGFFESVACVTGHIGSQDLVYVVVRRIINGATKRFIEMFEANHESVVGGGRGWVSMQTDSSVFYIGAPVSNITIPHLKGKLVDIIGDGSYRGQFMVDVVTGITTPDFNEQYSQVEGGLHYDSTVLDLPPTIQNQVMEGLPRAWNQLWVRLFETIGGKLNDQQIQYPPGNLGSLDLFTGDRQVTPEGWSNDGAVRIVQDQPYPMTILALFGTLEVGDHD